ncbi:DNA-3-methyladenine glycosylase, putative [Plasmodium ovale curtisi]|uniref:DNA-3-methyladenine glycosylase II n=1 Tax=Plasmodium ovale curtisi TaxID=864141 RepID=A0A1A8W3X5_PLAOA|nr:DNA-3-methyladenine glycosylase, putative [Plasmodium ovale curtisi]SBS96759.1 DNA-3-methyladenine glycosylase, putative [Plasmodium ovale curtisi]
MNILNEKFYLQKNVLSITEMLIGHILWTYDKNKNKLYGSRIIELECYNGIHDKASHAFNNKKTNRNISMFEKGGISYVYICYGIHNCLNIVTNVENVPDAILVRSLEPLYNLPFFFFNKYHDNSKRLSTNNKEKKAICSVNVLTKDKQVGNILSNENDVSTFIEERNYLKKIENLQSILSMVNRKKLSTLCSGPGCVTKCLDISRRDDKARFYLDARNYETGGENGGECKSECINENACADTEICVGSERGAARILSHDNHGREKPKKNDKQTFSTSERNAEKKKSSIHSDCGDCANSNDALCPGKCSYNHLSGVNPEYYFPCSIRYLKNGRFFITLCPSVNEIIQFYENLHKHKKDGLFFICDIYSKYKEHLLNYFEYMKWDDVNMTVQKDRRIGISYAEEAAAYEYRFLLRSHPAISVPPQVRKPPNNA